MGILSLLWHPLRLHFWLQTRGIKFIIFDFDDTLNDLFPIFQEAVASCDRFVFSLLPLDQHETVKRRLREINDHYFLCLSVNPNRWEFIFRDLLEEFGIYTENNFEILLEIIGRVYQTAPPLKKGAVELLLAYQRVRPLGLVTHANSDWHRLKVSQSGIGHFFTRQWVVDENRHKDREAWGTVLKSWSLKPGHVLVIEDNMRSLRELSSLGVQNLIWLNPGSGWGMYRDGERPQGLLVVDNLEALLSPWLIS